MIKYILLLLVLITSYFNHSNASEYIEIEHNTNCEIVQKMTAALHEQLTNSTLDERLKQLASIKHVASQIRSRAISYKEKTTDPKTFYKKLFESQLKAHIDRPVKILVVRHGQTDWNVQNISQGQTDIPLNTKGREQAYDTTQQLLLLYGNSIDAIYSSPLQRALDTAHIIGTALNRSVTSLVSLQERHIGVGEGMAADERRKLYNAVEVYLNQKFPAFPERGYYCATPGAETWNEVVERAFNALSYIISHHAGQTVLVVSHSSYLTTLLKTIEPSFDSKLSNCCIVELTYNPSRENYFEVKLIHNLERKSHV